MGSWLWPWGHLLVSPLDSLAAHVSRAGAHPAGCGVPGDTAQRMLQIPYVPGSRYMQDTAPCPQPSSPNGHWHPRAPSTARTQITPSLEQPKHIRTPGGSSASPSTPRQRPALQLPPHCQAFLKPPWQRSAAASSGVRVPTSPSPQSPSAPAGSCMACKGTPGLGTAFVKPGSLRQWLLAAPRPLQAVFFHLFSEKFGARRVLGVHPLQPHLSLSTLQIGSFKCITSQSRHSLNCEALA